MWKNNFQNKKNLQVKEEITRQVVKYRVQQK